MPPPAASPTTSKRSGLAAMTSSAWVPIEPVLPSMRTQDLLTDLLCRVGCATPREQSQSPAKRWPKWAILRLLARGKGPLTSTPDCASLRRNSYVDVTDHSATPDASNREDGGIGLCDKRRQKTMKYRSEIRRCRGQPCRDRGPGVVGMFDGEFQFRAVVGIHSVGGGQHRRGHGTMEQSMDPAADLVGAGLCRLRRAVPTGAGSVDGMSHDPVAVAASNNPLLTTLTAAVSGKLNPDVEPGRHAQRRRVHRLRAGRRRLRQDRPGHDRARSRPTRRR